MVWLLKMTEKSYQKMAASVFSCYHSSDHLKRDLIDLMISVNIKLVFVQFFNASLIWCHICCLASEYWVIRNLTQILETVTFSEMKEQSVTWHPHLYTGDNRTDPSRCAPREDRVTLSRGYTCLDRSIPRHCSSITGQHKFVEATQFRCVSE